jgi:hypothetical protein
MGIVGLSRMYVYTYVNDPVMSQVLLVQNSYNVINYNLKEVLVTLDDFATITCYVQILCMFRATLIPNGNPMMIVVIKSNRPNLNNIVTEFVQ